MPDQQSQNHPSVISKEAKTNNADIANHIATKSAHVSGLFDLVGHMIKNDPVEGPVVANDLVQQVSAADPDAGRRLADGIKQFGNQSQNADNNELSAEDRATDSSSSSSQANSDSTACSKLQTKLDNEKFKWDVEWELVQDQDAIVKDLRAKLDSAVTDFRDQGQLQACENAAKGVKAMSELVISKNPLSAFSSIIDYITSSAAGIRENWKNLDEIGNIDKDFDAAGKEIRKLWRALKTIDGDIAAIKKDMENRNCEIGENRP